MTQPITLAELRKLDPETLVTLVLAQQEQLLNRDAEIEHLKLLIAKLKRMQFGRSSEKLDRQIAQLELRLEELQTTQAENTAGTLRQSASEPPANVPTRRPLPEHLPRETRTYLPKQEKCPDCGSAFKPRGEDVAETFPDCHILLSRKSDWR